LHVNLSNFELDLDSQSSRLGFKLFILLALRLLFLFRFARVLSLKLIGSPEGNVLGLVIPEAPLETLFDEPAGAKVEDHRSSDHPLEVAGERNELEFGVEFGNELGCTGECDTRNEDEAPVHALIFADGLTEGTALVVDGKGRNLLDELQEVDSRVEEGWLKLLLEIGVGVLRLDTLNVLRDVDQSCNMDSKLSEDGANDVGVEDVVLWSLFRESLNSLKYC
jgi:hypothetical protein